MSGFIAKRQIPDKTKQILGFPPVSQKDNQN